MSPRHAYALHEAYKLAPGAEYDYATVCQSEVSGPRLAELADQLEAWAEQVLRDGELAPGLYTAEFSTLNFHDDTSHCLHELTVLWNGTTATITPNPD